MLLAGLSLSAGAGQFRLAGVQTERSPIASSVNQNGYRISVCVSPLACKTSRNPACFKVQIGILDNSVPIRNAARLWALYE